MEQRCIQLMRNSDGKSSVRRRASAAAFAVVGTSEREDDLGAALRHSNWRHTSVGNGGASPSGGPRRCGDERLWPGACLDSVLNGGTRDNGRQPSGSLNASSG